MGHPSAEQVAQRAFDLGLLTERQLLEIWGTLGTRAVPLSDFLQLLIRREMLTNYQVERLVKGERSGFFYGPYKVLYLLGSGTFARVYRAVHRETGAVVALKVLRRRYSENPAQYTLFVREGRVGCSLRHPNIVPIYEVVSQGKNHFLVMEYVEGWNLRDLVKIRKKVETLDALRLMMGITQGLRYAFEHGLTHRDLKLSNVLVASSGEPKIVDFGLAAMDETMDDMSDDLPNTRTIDYAALERATGVRKDDTRSDIYFAGCILYHMLTGQAPLPDTKDRLQRLSKQRFLEVVPIQKLDPGLSHWAAMVVNKAMSLDPTRRYQTPAAMLADLHIAERQLTQEMASGGPRLTAGAVDTSSPAGGSEDENRRTIMVVESDQKMQDMFRERLRRAGYRVLLISDPARAVDRCRRDATVADCVLFNAQAIGRPALDEFNMLGNDNKAHFVRAILLLDESQKEWEGEARTALHRIVLALPLTMKQLRERLAALLEMTVG